MNKCDFCTNSFYVNGKVACNSHMTIACKEAIKAMSEVMKEEYRSRNSTNVNKNYNYNKGNKR